MDTEKMKEAISAIADDEVLAIDKNIVNTLELVLEKYVELTQSAE